MSRELILLPEVSRDLVEGCNYYEERSPGSGGARFEAVFNEALDQIENGVITHRRVFIHFHRVLLPRCSYTLYYRLVENRAVITALLYSRFDPKRIEETLRTRLR